MDEKKISKLTKKELLEILLSQAKRIEEVELELENCNKRLESRDIIIDSVGSIAEASLQLNGIFEAAQATVDQYMANVYDRCRKLENDTKEECQKMKDEALEYADKVREKAKNLLEKNKEKKDNNKLVGRRIKNKSGKSFKKRKVNS